MNYSIIIYVSYFLRLIFIVSFVLEKVTKEKPSKNFDQTPQVASSCKHISTPMDVNSSGMII